MNPSTKPALESLKKTVLLTANNKDNNKSVIIQLIYWKNIFLILNNLTVDLILAYCLKGIASPDFLQRSYFVRKS